MNHQPPWLDAEAVARLLPMAEAIAAVEGALHSGLDPSTDPARGVVEVNHGQLLLMPSQTARRVGVKVASVAAGNPTLGLPRIQAIYVLFDADTLTPIALLDGTAITSLRTPAVSAVAAKYLAPPEASHLVVFGAGLQAWGHVEAIRAVRPIQEVTVFGRDRTRLTAFVQRINNTGLRADAGRVDAVFNADIVACATTASTPLFPAHLVSDRACVIAVGSHEPQHRELDASLLTRASVVVEDRVTAMREAGDIILAIEDAAFDASTLLNLSSVVVGRVKPSLDMPRVFKSVGMAWQDLVIASEVHRRHVDH